MFPILLRILNKIRNKDTIMQLYNFVSYVPLSKWTKILEDLVYGAFTLCLVTQAQWVKTQNEWSLGLTLFQSSSVHPAPRTCSEGDPGSTWCWCSGLEALSLLVLGSRTHLPQHTRQHFTHFTVVRRTRGRKLSRSSGRGDVPSSYVREEWET